MNCVSSDDDDLHAATRFTNRYVRVVVQIPPPSKCVLLSASSVVRALMSDWVLSVAGDRWSVKLDVRDLGGGTLALIGEGCFPGGRGSAFGFCWYAKGFED